VEEKSTPTSELTFGNMFKILCISTSLAQSIGTGVPVFVIVGAAEATDDSGVIFWRRAWGHRGRDVVGVVGEGARISRKRSSIVVSSTVGGV
jgi:hypothetical protein